MPGQIFTPFFIFSITNTISSISINTIITDIIVIVFIIRQVELLLASIYRPFNHYCLFIDPRWGWSIIINHHDDLEDAPNTTISLHKVELICMMTLILMILAVLPPQLSLTFLGYDLEIQGGPIVQGDNWDDRLMLQKTFQCECDCDDDPCVDEYQKW